MKIFNKGITGLFLLVILVLSPQIQAEASDKDTICSGVYAEHISLEGMDESQARLAVEDYVEQIKEKKIVLRAVEDNEVEITATDLGIYWSNPEIIDEAMALGKKGNIVKRYKAVKDLERKNQVYAIEISYDSEIVRQIIQEKCAVFNVEAVDATLERVDGNFIIKGGVTGCIVEEEASILLIADYLQTQWDKEDCVIDLEVITDEPRGNEEELSKVQDVLGTCTTEFTSSGSSRSANVTNGANLINGTTLYPGDEFSSYAAVSPFSADNGYFMAGSYINGQVVDSIGGGICQVTTTLYNAVLLAELEVTERHNHSMIVTYVQPSKDAAIAESAGKDFKFVNNLEHPIYIEAYATPDKNITFTIYGVETRAAERTVEYYSEVVSTTYPDSEVIIASDQHPVGYISVQSSHTGYQANLWKIVKENNVEVSREKINSSSYKMVPRYATVGVVTEDPNAHNEIVAAISTNNIDHVKNVAAALAPPAPPAEEPVQEAPPQEGQ